MSERTVKVKCEGVCKLVNLTQRFDEFKETIRTRLNLDTEEMSIKAIFDGDEDEYDIDNDDDLQAVWKNMKELRITPNQFERLNQETVEINDAKYRLDVPMAGDSPIVKGLIDEYHLGDFINRMKAVSTTEELLSVATVTSGVSTLINRMDNINFSIREILCNAKLLMSDYEQTSSHVIEAFQRMILYLCQNDSKNAVMSLATVEKFVHQCREGTTNLVEKIEQVITQINEFIEKITCGHTGLPGIKTQIAETQKRESDREKEGAKVNKKADAAAYVGLAGVGGGAGLGIAAVVTGGVGTALIAAPLFLFAAGLGGGALYALFKDEKIALEKKGKLNRQELDKLRDEERELEQMKIDVRRLLKEMVLDQDSEENVYQCLHFAKQPIKLIRNALQRFSADWKTMEMAFQKIRTSHPEPMKKQNEEGCSNAFRSRGFKMQVVQYYARWVALKVFARQCNETLEELLTTFNDRKIYTTREEARARLQICLKAAEDEGLVQPSE